MLTSSWKGEQPRQKARMGISTQALSEDISELFVSRDVDRSEHTMSNTIAHSYA